MPRRIRWPEEYNRFGESLSLKSLAADFPCLTQRELGCVNPRYLWFCSAVVDAFPNGWFGGHGFGKVARTVVQFELSLP